MKKLKTNKVYIGNCLDVLKTFPDESIDMCITSPPYWGLRDYGTEGQVWGGDENCKHEFESSKRKLHSGSWGKKDNVLPHFKNATVLNWEVEDRMCNKCGAWKGELGLEPTPDMFVDHLCDIFDEVKRVLKPEGNCWVNLGDTYANTGYGKGSGNMQHKNKQGAMAPKVKCDLPQKCLVQIPSRFALEMTNRGWILRNEIIWHKPSCLPSPATDRFTVDFEKMFFFTKKKKYYFKQQLEPIQGNYTNEKRPMGVLRQKTYENSKYVKAGMVEKSDKKISELKSKTEIRNKRAVWSVNTASFKEAHFAVYPPELIRVPIDAGCPEKVCKKCGKAMEEIVERPSNPKGIHGRAGKPMVSKDGVVDTADGKRTIEPGHNSSVGTNAKLIGYTDCGCGDDFVPGIVLDPFFGSGTTAEVAMEQDKDWVGIELNPEFEKISKKRLKPTITEKKTRDKSTQFWS